jgi:DNA-binding CsgD family transcriptional regulator
MHLPQGLHFMIGVDRDKDVPDDPAEMTRLTAALCLFAVHAQDAALQLLLPGKGPLGAPSLTPRELESLRWTMEGKTAWEMGCILGISEQTAGRHIHNAMRKLDCVNKTQAALKAVRFGFIG